MKKILTLFSVVLLFSAIAVSVNSGIQPLADNEIQFETVSTLPASTNLTFTPKSDGTIKLFYINIKNYFANYLYGEPNGVDELPEDDSFIYQNPSSNAIYTEAAGTQFEYNVTAGTTYYLWNTSELQYYAVFIPAGGGNAGDFIEIELDQPTNIPIDQKGIFHCDFTGQLQVQAVTNMGTLAGQQKSFLFTDEACVDAVPVVSSTPGAYYDTFVYKVDAGTDYYVYYDDSSEKSITYTFTNLGAVEVPKVEFDQQVNYVKGTEYEINVDGPCQIAITTSIQLGESELMYGMISYKISGVSRRISDYTIEQDGSNYTYIYTLSNPNNPTEDTFYFNCQVTGDYTFSIYVPKDEEPSSAVAKIDYPETSVKNFSSFIIVWGSYENLTMGTMLGATITFPNNETYPMTRYTLGPAKDGQTADNSLTVMFDPVAEANGTYTITLPQGVVKIDGKPNKEQTLTFNHQWVPDYLDYLASVVNDELTNEDNSVKLTWNNTPVRLTTAEFEIPVRFNGNQIGVISDPEYLTLENDGIATSEVGTVLDISLGMAGVLNGPGEYQLDLPQGLVEDDGFISRAQTVSFTITGPAADENQIQFETVATLPASTDLTFTPTTDGTLKLFYIDIKNYFANYLYGEPNGVDELPEDDSMIYQNPSSNAIYTASAGTQFEYNVTAGTTYYLWNTSELQYYAVFVPAGGGNTGDFIEIELDEPTNIPIDQKGIFHCDFTGKLQVEAVTNMGTLAGQQKSFLFTDEACENAVPVVSSTPGAYFDTFVYEVEADTDYYVYYDDSSESSITYTFINLGSVVVPEVTFDERVQYEQGTDYLIAVEGDCQISIETAATFTEQELMYGMIYYKNGGANQSIRDYIIKDAGFNSLYIYTLKGSPDNIYYFSCKKTANYTFTIYTAADEEPSTATAKITNPLTDVKTFANFVIVWDNYLTISNGSMLGATITGPDNETYNVTRYTIGAADDNHNGDNSLSLSFSPQAEANGTYTIYLPKGVVYIDGKPNQEQTLTFDHEWVPDFLGEATVVNAVLTNEDNSVKLTWNNTPVRLTTSAFEIPVRFNGEQIGVIDEPEYLTLENEDGSAASGLGTVLDISLGMAGLLEGAGTYELDLPQALVEDDGIISPAQTVTFTITDGTEEAATVNDYLGTVTGRSSGSMGEFDYILNYTIVYNEDKTLTISGEYVWPGGQTPIGYTGISKIDISGKVLEKNADGVFNTGQFDLTYNEGETVTFDFFVEAMQGRVSETIEYVVGRPFNVQVKEDPKQEGIVENVAREISIRTANQEAELTVNAPQGATVYYQLSDVVNTQNRAIEGYTEATGNVIKLASNTSGNLSLYYSLNGEDSEPVTYAYSVLLDLSTGVESIDAANEEGAEFFNLQGVKVKNPESGLYIKVVNGKATKVMIRK